MRSYRNPFRVRTSEVQHRQGASPFLNTYGPAVLDLLPNDIWDRLFVIRSAPGGGKTSLMKLLEAESLRALHERRDKLADLEERLSTIGALDATGPTVLGTRVDLRRNYKALLDLAGPPELAARLFLRLLDARIIRGVLQSALTLSGRRFPVDVDQVRIQPSDRGQDAIERLGGSSGGELLESSRSTEKEMLDLVDSLMPVSAEGHSGHSGLYALRALDEAVIEVGGEPLRTRNLVMFDDGQELHPTQRRALIECLINRDLVGARWYAERLQAVPVEEVLGDEGPGDRDVRVLELEATARRGLAPDSRPTSRRRTFDPLLLDIADRRARRPLQIYGEESDDFNTLIDIDEDELLGEDPDHVLGSLRAKAEAAAEGDRRYAPWLETAARKSGYQAALRWAELTVLIARDRDRRQGELFNVELDEGELSDRSSSGVREAASCFVAHEYRLPYYVGPERIPKLASFNIEQFLNLGASLFEEMLALITLGRTPDVGASRQDAIVRDASKILWREIPNRYSHGRDVQRLLLRIAEMSRRETFRPKAPYPPGVTGTAISIEDRERLLDPVHRAEIPGADRLYVALGQAVAFNLLEADHDYSVKGRRWTVLYLNRLLCPLFDLPLGRGGFRERKLSELASWVLPRASGPREADESDFFAQLRL